MGRGADRYIVPCVIGVAPVLLVALAWAPTGDWTFVKLFTRSYAAPVIGSELFSIVVAIREGMLKSLRRWKWSIPVLLAVAILLVIVTATALLATMPRVAIILSVYWIVHVLFGLSVVHLCGRLFNARDLTLAYLAGFALFAAEFFAFISAIPDWGRFDWKNGFMAFSHIRHAGYYLAAVGTLGIGAMAASERRASWLWAWVSASVAMGIALWTGSRGAMLAIAGALALGVLLLPAVRSIRCWGGTLSGLALALAAVRVAPAAAPSHLMGLTHAVQQTASADVTTGRTTIWKNVIAAIRERPFFGYGEGQMHTVAPTWTMVQPHDSILQVTLAWGLVGLLCVLTIAIAYARRAIPAVRRESGWLVPPFMTMSALAILSLYDGALYYALPQSIFMACAAMIASAWTVTAEKSPEASTPVAVTA